MQGGNLMAERRMFAKTIIDSDVFLDMPLTAQALYFHLSMRADDDGFVNNPKKIQRMIGVSDDDCKLLIAKNFIIAFESGVIVIKHWKIHNYIRNDRYKATAYEDEKALLSLEKNGGYTIGIPNDNQMDTQDRLGKVSIGKVSIGKDKLTISNDIVCQAETARPNIEPVINAWNFLSEDTAIKPISKISYNSIRYNMLSARLKEYGIDDVLKAIENIRQSDFLKGNNDRGWIITFDWFVKPNNFPKVLEGNYCNSVETVCRQTKKKSKYDEFMADLAAIREECIKNGE